MTLDASARAYPAAVQLTIDHPDYADTLYAMTGPIITAVQERTDDAYQELIDRALIVEAPPGVDPAVALLVLIAAQAQGDRNRRPGWWRSRALGARLARRR